MSEILDLIPEHIRKKIIDNTVDSLIKALSKQIKTIPGGEKVASRLNSFRSDADFRQRFGKAVNDALARFADDFSKEDFEIVEVILRNKSFFESEEIQDALVSVMNHPDQYLAEDTFVITLNFSKLFPNLSDKNRIDNAVKWLLKYIAEAIWLMPEFEKVYSLMFSKMTVEAVRQQVELAKLTLNETVKNNQALLDALYTLTDTIGQRKIASGGGNIIELPSGQTNHASSRIASSKPNQRWGSAPDTSSYLGHEKLLKNITDSILSEKYRLIGILGVGGIGKTLFATKVARSIADHFEYLIWYSLRDAPPLFTVLDDIVGFISDSKYSISAGEASKGIDLLLEHFRQYRCLIVLDNYEAVLEGQIVGHYRNGYEDYGNFIHGVGNSVHNSSIMLTSREKPSEIALLEIQQTTQSLELPGLSVTEVQRLLHNKSLSGASDSWDSLVEAYSGNPLALLIVSEIIRDVYDSRIEAFINENEFIFGDIKALLDSQFNRISDLEKQIMVWLAIEREPITREELYQIMIGDFSRKEQAVAINSLRRRCLAESTALGFTLQNVIMEYLDDYIVNKIVDEVSTLQPFLFRTHALIRAKAKDYMRESQIRLVVDPIIKKLQHNHSNGALLVDRFKALISLQRTKKDMFRGYISGNSLNLLLYVNEDLSGWDLSGLEVRDALLSGYQLRGVNFENSHFINSVFTDCFGNILGLDCNLQGDLIAASSADGKIRVWDTHTGMLRNLFIGHTDWVWNAKFSPSGKVLATCSSDHTVKIWGLDTGILQTTLSDHKGRVRSIDFSSDGKYLSSGSEDNTVYVWDMNTFEKVVSFETGYKVLVLTFLPCDDHLRLAVSGENYSIEIWEITANEAILLQTLSGGHSKRVTALKPIIYNNIHYLASGSEDCKVLIWDIDHEKSVFQLIGHEMQVWSICQGEDNSIYSASEDTRIIAWDIGNEKILSVIRGHTKRVRALAYNQTHKELVSGGYDKTVRFWDVSSGKCLRMLKGYSNMIWEIECSPVDNTLASSNEVYNLELWNLETKSIIKTLGAVNSQARTIAFSRDGELIATGGDSRIISVWNTKTEQVHSIGYHDAYIWAVEFNPRDNSIASSNDRTICIWDITSGHLLNKLDGHQGRIWSISYDSTGEYLASASSDHTVRVWNLALGKCLFTLSDHANIVWSVKFSASTKLLASGSDDNTVILWDGDSGRLLRRLVGHTSWIGSVAFNKTDTILASAGGDATIRLWDTHNWECIAILRGHTSLIQSVSFNFDSNLLVSAGDDETIRIWDINTCKSVDVLHSPGPYKDMRIKNVQGLTKAQIEALVSLGAKHH